MAMEQLKENVMKEVQQELNRANEKFPLFNSIHESYAVILEEAEETEEALETAKASLGALWYKARNKEAACTSQVMFWRGERSRYASHLLQEAARPAQLAEKFALVACEAIQAAAMCLKYGLSVSPEEPEAEKGGAADE